MKAAPFARTATTRWRSPKATVDNDGRFELLAADMKPYRSGSRPRPGAWGPVLPPDAHDTGRAQIYANPCRCGMRPARPATARPGSGSTPPAGTGRLSSAVWTTTATSTCTRSTACRRGVRSPARRGAAVERLANARRTKPAPDAVAERVEVLAAPSAETWCSEVRSYLELLQRVVDQTKAAGVRRRDGAGEREGGEPVRAAHRHHLVVETGNPADSERCLPMLERHGKPTARRRDEWRSMAAMRRGRAAMPSKYIRQPVPPDAPRYSNLRPNAESRCN